MFYAVKEDTPGTHNDNYDKNVSKPVCLPVLLYGEGEVGFNAREKQEREREWWLKIWYNESGNEINAASIYAIQYLCLVWHSFKQEDLFF